MTGFGYDGDMERVGKFIVGLAVITASSWCFAYEPATHQQLTFLAAKHFNRCFAGTDSPALTPLQVRYIAKANVAQADANMFRRMFRWSYYNREDQADRSVLWLWQTRLHSQFNDAALQMNSAAGDPDTYSRLGQVVGHVQEVTSPAHVVPVFASRWWRFSFSDRFDNYPVDEDSVEVLLARACGNPVEKGEFLEVLNYAAQQTLSAVQTEIPGMPISWQAFWHMADDENDFGEYGPAGNSFGSNAEFDCGESETCVLLKNDPLYKQFAAIQHSRAVIATAMAIKIAQQQVSKRNALAIE